MVKKLFFPQSSGTPHPFYFNKWNLHRRLVYETDESGTAQGEKGTGTAKCLIEAGLPIQGRVCLLWCWKRFLAGHPPPFFFGLFRATPCSIWRLRVELKLQLLAYTTATATQDLSCICDLHHSSWQSQILNPQSKARDRTCVFMDASQILFSAELQWELPPPIFLWWPDAEAWGLYVCRGEMKRALPG